MLQNLCSIWNENYLRLKSLMFFRRCISLMSFFLSFRMKYLLPFLFVLATWCLVDKSYGATTQQKSSVVAKVVCTVACTVVCTDACPACLAVCAPVCSEVCHKKRYKVWIILININHVIRYRSLSDSPIYYSPRLLTYA